MLVKPTIEELLPKVENRYTLALTVAKRARQLVDGAKPLINEDRVQSPSLVSLAAEELAEDRIVGLPGEHDPYIPIRPEVLLEQQDYLDDDEDDFEGLRQNLEATEPKTDEEEEEEPKSMIRELTADEFFELPSELEQEFVENLENYGDNSAGQDDTVEKIEEEVAEDVEDEESHDAEDIKKSEPRVPAEGDDEEPLEPIEGEEIGTDHEEMTENPLKDADEEDDDADDDDAAETDDTDTDPDEDEKKED